MGKGTVAKKRGGKGSGDDAEKKILKEQLDSTGPFILRDFCRQHGMDPDDAKTFPKTKLISFLMGKFKDGELTLNDLYPDKEGGKKSGGKKSSSKSKAEDTEPDDDGLDDDEDNDGAGDDDMDDDDDLDFELDGDDDGDDDGDGDGGDDDDLEDEANDELDDDDGDNDNGKDSDNEDGPDISIIEDKLDKIIDQNSSISKSLDLLIKVVLETGETVRQGMKVLFKIGKVKNPGKLLKQIEGKARKFAGIENGDGDDDLEDE